MTTKKTGRPPFEPTTEMRETVEFMAAAGIKHETIAKILSKTMAKCSYSTLRKHFKNELELGLDMANANIAQGLYQLAQNGDLGAMCFWLKTRARWRETSRLEIDDLRDDPESARAAAKMMREVNDPNQASQVYSDMVTGIGQPKH